MFHSSVMRRSRPKPTTSANTGRRGLPRQTYFIGTIVIAAIASSLSGQEPPAASRPDAGDENKSLALFDGKSFAGWEGNLDMFRIEDGAIVAGSLQEKIPRNEFLSTKQEFGDFELQLQFKIVGDKANAGVQIRSRRIPDHHEMIGYQADLGDGWWGCLYDESRRKKILAGPPAEKRNEPIRRNQWNDYRIRCEGRRIQLWINGVQTVDYTEQDPDIEQNGMIAVQVHSGPPMEAWYRNIRLTKL